MSLTQDPSYYETFEAEWAEESAWNAQLAAEATEEMSEEAAAMVDAHEAQVAIRRGLSACRKLDEIEATVAAVSADCARERTLILAKASRESYGDYLARLAETDEEIPASLPGGEDAEIRRNVRLLGVA